MLNFVLTSISNQSRALYIHCCGSNLEAHPSSLSDLPALSQLSFSNLKHLFGQTEPKILLAEKQVSLDGGSDGLHWRPVLWRYLGGLQVHVHSDL